MPVYLFIGVVCYICSVCLTMIGCCSSAENAVVGIAKSIFPTFNVEHLSIQRYLHDSVNSNKRARTIFKESCNPFFCLS